MLTKNPKNLSTSTVLQTKNHWQSKNFASVYFCLLPSFFLHEIQCRVAGKVSSLKSSLPTHDLCISEYLLSRAFLIKTSKKNKLPFLAKS